MDEATSFGGRLSLAQFQQAPRIFSFFLPGTVQIFARAGVREHPCHQPPKAGPDSKDGKSECPSFLPLNLSRPEIGEVAPGFDPTPPSKT